MRKVLFIHQNFPGQFRHLAPALAAAGCQVLGLTINPPAQALPGVAVVNYDAALQAQLAATGGRPVDGWESKLMRGRAAAEAMRRLRDQGFVPDVVFAHSGWGEALFVRDVFPQARFLVYAEYYYGAPGGDIGFDPEFARPPAVDDAERTLLKNTHLLHALSSCDAALAPTEFQRSQHPAWAQQKIRVIHEGIDTARFRPDPAASLQLQAAGVTLRGADEIVTFVARHLEPYRGYHGFMRALPLLQQLRPKARVVLVGGDGVSYGPPAGDGKSWKQVFLDEVAGRVDLSRVHFVGKVPHAVLTQLMQVASVHAYLTYPFVLSWSMLEAMSIGCLVVGSATAPVRELIRDGENGYLVDFFDHDALARRIADALEHRADNAPLRQQARADIVAGYDLRSICLPQQIDFVLGR